MSTFPDKYIKTRRAYIIAKYYMMRSISWYCNADKKFHLSQICIGMTRYLLCWQFSPEKSSRHSQVRMLLDSLQRPPFWQGDVSHKWPWN